MNGEVVRFPSAGYSLEPNNGSAGLPTQIPGAMTSVSSVSAATGGIGSGNMIDTDTK